MIIKFLFGPQNFSVVNESHLQQRLQAAAVTMVTVLLLCLLVVIDDTDFLLKTESTLMKR